MSRTKAKKVQELAIVHENACGIDVVRQATLRLTLRAEYAFPNAYSGFNV